MNSKMQISLQRNSSWLADVSYQNFPSCSDQVNLISGDGQSISLPLSFIVASSPFLQSLLPLPCACPTSPTISLPSTTGLTLKMLAQIFSNGETELLVEETTETCVKSLQEVLELLRSEVKVVLDIDCVKSLKVVNVISLAHETVVVKEEFESYDNWDGSLAVHEKVDSDCPQDCWQEGKVFSSPIEDFQPIAQIGNLGSTLNTNGEATSQTRDSKIKRLQCPFCERNFLKLKSLISHKKSKHAAKVTKKRKYSCKKCDFRVSSAKDLAKHMSDIHGENDESENLDQINNLVQCPECGLHFANESHLKAHITKKHKVVGDQIESEDFAVNKKRVKCSECKLTFTRRLELKRHIKRVHEGVVYACGVCHKIASQKNNMYSHCKAFCHDKKLIYEIEGHSGNVTFIVRCSECGIAFRNDSLLKQHVAKKHKIVGDEEGGENKNNKTRVKCSQCKKTFYNKSNLNRHTEQVHEGVLYACGVCDFVSYKRKIVAHCIKSGHDQDLIYKIQGRLEVV